MISVPQTFKGWTKDWRMRDKQRFEPATLQNIGPERGKRFLWQSQWSCPHFCPCSSGCVGTCRTPYAPGGQRHTIVRQKKDKVYDIPHRHLVLISNLFMGIPHILINYNNFLNANLNQFRKMLTKVALRGANPEFKGQLFLFKEHQH